MAMTKVMAVTLRPVRALVRPRVRVLVLVRAGVLVRAVERCPPAVRGARAALRDLLAAGCSPRDRRRPAAEASSRSFSLSSRRVGWPASGVADVSLERAGIGEVGRSGVNGAVGFRSFSDVHRGMPLH
jgi:hypothetical protein